jgi:polysaccharide export outer membrane protein
MKLFRLGGAKSPFGMKAVIGGTLVLLMSSCGINSNLMLKTENDYVFANVDSLNATKEEYKLDVNDIIQFRFFTNDALKVLDLSTATEPGQNQAFNPNNLLNYVIQTDSMLSLPAIGQVNLVGYTIREAEIYLQEAYSELYVNPFVQITVTNKRVIVFPGSGGDAQVIYLANNNTTLLEAIAMAGGITERGRASRIKLIRKDVNGKRVVYRIDLSTIEGLAYTDILVQANDYIYVEPVPELGREILKEVAPIISIITSGAIVISVISKL